MTVIKFDDNKSCAKYLVCCVCLMSANEIRDKKKSVYFIVTSKIYLLFVVVRFNVQPNFGLFHFSMHYYSRKLSYIHVIFLSVPSASIFPPNSDASWARIRVTMSCDCVFVYRINKFAGYFSRRNT